MLSYHFKKSFIGLNYTRNKEFLIQGNPELCGVIGLMGGPYLEKGKFHLNFSAGPSVVFARLPDPDYKNRLPTVLKINTGIGLNGRIEFMVLLSKNVALGTVVHANLNPYINHVYFPSLGVKFWWEYGGWGRSKRF